ncbi:MAG: ATP-binding protein [Candidatus Omnitrophota bacterium]
MSLKTKLTLLIIICSLAMILTFRFMFELIVQPSLEKQKIIFIQNTKDKIGLALTNEKDIISHFCDQVLKLEDIPHYIQYPSREFENDMFPDEIIDSKAFVDLVAVTNLQNNYLFFKSCDWSSDKKKFVTVSELGIGKAIRKIKDNIRGYPAKDSGIISSTRGAILYVAEPIFSKQQVKKTIGVLIMGRFFNHYTTKRIQGFTASPIAANAFFPGKSKEKKYIRVATNNDLYYKDDPDKLYIYYSLNNIFNNPAVTVITSNDNKIFLEIQEKTTAFLFVTFASLILFGLMLYLAVDTQIVKRVLKVSGTMKEIEGLEDLSKRITGYGRKDEIAYLAANFNAMLDKLEQEKINRENVEKIMIINSKMASIGRLASCMGHEINNPLLSISNSIQVLKKIGCNDPDVFQEVIEISESEVARIREIIASLLDFQRLEGEEFTQVKVSDIMRKSIDILRLSKKLGNTRIIPNFDDPFPVFGSPVKLEQVFIHFILNAVEAMENMTGDRHLPCDLMIEIKAYTEKESDHFVEIRFQDNGPGVPEEIKKTLFEPFVSTKGIKGVGLGLYLSYKIIRNHNGEIIYDETYKQGAHFIIKLPIIKEV